jgi:predicted metal-binding membrane protein
MGATSPIESILKKDRALVLAGVVAVAILAWAYLFYLAWDMRQDMSQGMGAGSMSGGMNQALTQVRAWTGVDFLLMFLMWAVMMTAMMVPTAAPMILTFATINRKRLEQQQPYVPTVVFLLGYLVVWSALATAAPPWASS